jgi:hypothetical protein
VLIKFPSKDSLRLASRYGNIFGHVVCCCKPGVRWLRLERRPMTTIRTRSQICRVLLIHGELRWANARSEATSSAMICIYIEPAFADKLPDAGNAHARG